MAFSIPRDQVVAYPPQGLRSFQAYAFEWIDNLHFLADPSAFVAGDAEPYLAVARQRFLDEGWTGDGTIQLLWLPPFVFAPRLRVASAGLVLWHVKQSEDGISFILSPVPLPFEELQP